MDCRLRYQIQISSIRYYTPAVKNQDFLRSLEVGLPTMVRNMVSGYLDMPCKKAHHRRSVPSILEGEGGMLKEPFLGRPVGSSALAENIASLKLVLPNSCLPPMALQEPIDR